jgi:hypothetical protein
MANESQRVDSIPSGRRSFLKAGAGLGAALLAVPAAANALAGERANLGTYKSGQTNITKYRTLGSGKHSENLRQGRVRN